MKKDIGKKMINKSEETITKSNFKLLEIEYSDIIISSEDKDQNNRISDRYAGRRTFKLKDYSFISITEIYKAEDLNVIDYYHYDWYNKDKTIRRKFHSEPHDDINYQTHTEPYHIHKPNKLDSEDRLPNHHHKRLSEILEHIRLSID